MKGGILSSFTKVINGTFIASKPDESEEVLIERTVEWLQDGTLSPYDFQYCTFFMVPASLTAGMQDALIKANQELPKHSFGLITILLDKEETPNLA